MFDLIQNIHLKEKMNLKIQVGLMNFGDGNEDRAFIKNYVKMWCMKSELVLRKHSNYTNSDMVMLQMHLIS
jgi:hypothetical protein